MSVFLRRKEELDKEGLNTLLHIKNKIFESKMHQGDLTEMTYMERLEKKIQDISIKLSEMDKKIDNIRPYKYLGTSDQPEGYRKSKIKLMIRSLLDEHKRLTANQLSKMVNLSRNRCSEYLKEMEADGITRGVEIRRQKFYETAR